MRNSVSEALWKASPNGRTELARVVRVLPEAGSPLKGVEYPTGDAAVDEVLHAYT
jgi:hypothetical protein